MMKHSSHIPPSPRRFTHRVVLYIIALAATVALAPLHAAAGVFGEHKIIGDEAFRRTVVALRSERWLDGLIDTLLADLEIISQGETHVWTRYSAVNPIGLGDLTGLAADHVGDPYELQSELVRPASKVNVCAGLHQVFMRTGSLAADDLPLTTIDFDYPMLAFANISHFYRYGRGLHEHLAEYDPTIVAALVEKRDNERVFDILETTNCLAKYLMMHRAALEIAHRAGAIHHADRAAAALELERAVFFEAYSLHLLQDAFSAGHLPVDRTFIGSVTHDLALHDLYGEAGLDVFNLRGDRWRCHGDGTMNQPFDLPRDATGGPLSFTMLFAIEANEISLRELFDAFAWGVEHRALPSPPERERERTGHLIATNGAMALVPVPFYTPNSEIGRTNAIWHDGDDHLHDHGQLRAHVGMSVAAGVGMTDLSRWWVTLSKRGIGIEDDLAGIATTGWLDVTLGLQAGRYAVDEPRSVDDAAERWIQATLGFELHMGRGNPLSVGVSLGVRSGFEPIVGGYGAVSVATLAGILPTLWGSARWDDNPLHAYNPRVVVAIDFTSDGVQRGMRRSLHMGVELDVPPLLDLVF